MENTNLTPENVAEKLNAIFSEKSAGFVSKEDAEAFNTRVETELEGLKTLDAKTNELSEVIAKFEGKLEALKETAKAPAKKMSLGQSITKTYEENLDAIKDAISRGGKVNLEVKDTTITGNYEGTFNLTDYDAEIDHKPRKRMGIMDVVNSGSTSSKFVTYVSQVKEAIGSWTPEAGEKDESAQDWAEVSEEVKKIATYVKVSKEMLEDLPFVRSEINNDLLKGLNESIEDALINGSGVGAVINGLLSIPMGLPAFTGAGFTGANAIPNANLSDVLRVAKAQIESANYTPTHVVLNPVDVAKLQLTKGTDGTYTYPIYLPEGGSMVIADMVVISSTFIAVDKYIIGDFSRINVKMREGLNLSVGLDKDDFTRNMVTILAEARLVQYVKQNQKRAFVQGDIPTDIALIDAP